MSTATNFVARVLVWCVTTTGYYFLNMSQVDPHVASMIEMVWNYHVMGVEPRPADMIFVLCSTDLRVADRAAELYDQGIAPRIAVSGNVGQLTRGLFAATEAEAFADRLIALGVPASVIILEKEATNTGENARFTRRLLEQMGITVQTAVCVQKPFMERRTFATIARQWPELTFTVTSPALGFDAWCAGASSHEAVINAMVGDLQRIIEYPKLGFQIAQDVPQTVVEAMQVLITLGYDKHLMATR